MGAITTDLRTGLAFCTRLPVAAPEQANLAEAAWSFPVVGALVGGAGALLFWQRRFPGGLMLMLLTTMQGLFSHTLLESRGLLLLYALALAVSVETASARTAAKWK